MALFYISANDLSRLAHGRQQIITPLFIDLLPVPPHNQLEALSPRADPAAPGDAPDNAPISFYDLTSHLSELCHATPNSQSFRPRNLADFVKCYRAPFHASPAFLDALNGKLRLEPDPQHRDQIGEHTQSIVTSFLQQGLEPPNFKLTNDPFLLKAVRSVLKGCIDHLDFDDARPPHGINPSANNRSRNYSGKSNRQASSAPVVCQAEDILLADLLLCSTESYRFQASYVTAHGMPFQLGASFRQANLILRHLYTIGRMSVLVQYAFAHEDDYYVPDAKGFHVASPGETIIAIDYKIPSRWSNEQLDDIYWKVDPSRRSTIRVRTPQANERPTVDGPTRNGFVDEVLYHVGTSSEKYGS